MRVRMKGCGKGRLWIDLMNNQLGTFGEEKYEITAVHSRCIVPAFKCKITSS
jgi:hypothetical protein